MCLIVHRAPESQRNVVRFRIVIMFNYVLNVCKFDSLQVLCSRVSNICVVILVSELVHTDLKTELR